MKITFDHTRLYNLSREVLADVYSEWIADRWESGHHRTYPLTIGTRSYTCEDIYDFAHDAAMNMPLATLVTAVWQKILRFCSYKDGGVIICPRCCHFITAES